MERNLIKNSVQRIVLLLIGIFILDVPLAWSHAGAGAVGGLMGGVMHPLNGLDHVIAMVAVGLWGAFLGAPALWLLPIVFPFMMTIGGSFGIMGIPIPSIETGIALSAVVLGGVVFLGARFPLWAASLVVAFFAIFHGYAHGAELPRAANAVTYSIGFVLTTGILHVSGIVLGLLTRWRVGKYVVRAIGGVIILLGIGFLFKIL